MRGRFGHGRRGGGYRRGLRDGTGPRMRMDGTGPRRCIDWAPWWVQSNIKPRPVQKEKSENE